MSKKNIIDCILRFIISIIIGIGIGIAISGQNSIEIAELHRHATAGLPASESRGLPDHGEAVLLESHFKDAVAVDRHLPQRGVHNLL